MTAFRCRRWRPLLTSHADDELAAADRHRLEAHLQTCEYCRQCLSREHAVRQRFRRWAAEMRDDGVSLAWTTGKRTQAGWRVGPLVRLGGVAAIGLLVVMWSRLPNRGGQALAAHGQITDSQCASGHTHTVPALQNMAAGDCVRRCVEMGAQYVFVSEGMVYAIRNQDLTDLSRLAGQYVQLEGEVRQHLLTVSHIRPLTARRLNDAPRARPLTES